MRIPEQDVKAILAQADIVDILGQVLPLEKKGKDYVTVCPFHDDHDPSMRISPDKQIYKCFVCGAGGNVFTFFQKHDGISFVESVKKVADILHYPLHLAPAVQRPKDPNEALYDTLNVFTAYCSYELYSQDGQQALKYLESRKFDKAMIDQFEIGFAPKREMVSQFLSNRFADRSLLEHTGLVRIGEDKLRPTFFDRIVIPIHDPQGHPVGYTARILPGSRQQAKYINTQSTALYDKSRLIFNYHRAIHACKKAKRLILCEGAMDVLGLAKAGMMEGIAALGTAMTPAQLALIAQAHVPVVVFYDQDAAGQKAAYQFGRKALQANIPFTIVHQDAAKDPDEIYISQGAEALKKIVSSTISFAAFCYDYLQTQYNLDNYEDKKAYAKEMERLIRITLDAYEQPAFFQRLEALTGFHFEAVQKKRRKDRRQPVVEERPAMPAPNGTTAAEKTLLWAILYEERFAQRFRKEIGFFSDPACAALYPYIYMQYRTSQDIDVQGLMETITEPQARQLLAELAEWPDFSPSIDTMFDKAVVKIKKDTMLAEIEDLNRKYLACTDPKEKMRLGNEKAKLAMRRIALQS